MKDGHKVSPATQWGLMAAGASAFCLLVPLFYGFSWVGAHCVPAPQCGNDVLFQFILGMVVVLVASTTIGVGVRRHALRSGKEWRAPNWYLEVFGLILLILVLYALQYREEFAGIDVFRT